jgi:hypothetical protein
MKFLDYLDRVGERRAQRIQRPRDIRQFIGFAFLAGYYWMVYQFSQRALPAENLDLIRDAMLTLGPPVGLIVGAMFRSDVRDEQATVNTGEAFRAIEATAKAATITDTPQQVEVVNTPESPANVTENPPPDSEMPPYAR